MHPDHDDEKQLAAERLQVFGSRLSRIAHKQVQKRAQIETRWLNDYRQYHGEYDPETVSRLKLAEGSELFVNITRNKTNAAEARLQDMLFPTDDRNWGIGPTPVPQLEQIEPGQMGQGPDGEPVDLGQVADEVMREARKKAEMMQTEIDDQLKESRYQIKARDVIHDAAVVGTGVLKGPVIVGRTRKRWDTDQSGLAVLTVTESLEPAIERVDPWDFFPDMSARTIDEAEFVFERHLWSKRQLREFARLPGALTEQVRAVVRAGKDSAGIAKDYTNDIRAITGVDSVSTDTKYEVWEYHGPIRKDELLDALDEAGEPLGPDECDELDDEIEAVVFFSGNHVLKVVLNPMDTGDRPYSVFNWEKDESCIFGFGIPYLMRHAQRVINAAWRMMMDNAGASVSDIIVANRELITPADGNWSSQPGKKKLYFLKEKSRDVREAFASFTIPNHQAELAAIFQMARQLADEETNLPLIAQGEQSAHVTKTSSGMAMLMNSANIVLRRAVKNWDDDMTRPTITRFYDWNMQYSDKPDIKGDYTVDARGSGALLVREKQQENLMIYANISAGNPELAIRRDWAGLDREIAKSLEVPYHTITLSDADIEAKRKQMAENAQQGGEDQLKMAELQLKQAQLQMDQQKARAEAQRKQLELQQEAQYNAAKLAQERELKLAEIAARENLTVAQLQAKVALDEARIKTEREKAAGDLALKRTTTQLQAQNLANGNDTF
jgi:hypothetical protein